jgi:hypothetical protein
VLPAALSAGSVQYAKLTSEGDFAGASVGYDSVFRVYGSYTPITWTAGLQDTATGWSTKSTRTPGDTTTPVSTNWSVARTGTSVTWSFGGTSASYHWAPDTVIDLILLKVTAYDERLFQTRTASATPLKLDGVNLYAPSNQMPVASNGAAFLAMQVTSLDNFSLTGSSRFTWSGGSPTGQNLGISLEFLRLNPDCAVPEPGTFGMLAVPLMACGVTWRLRRRRHLR